MRGRKTSSFVSSMWMSLYGGHGWVTGFMDHVVASCCYALQRIKHKQGHEKMRMQCYLPDMTPKWKVCLRILCIVSKQCTRIKTHWSECTEYSRQWILSQKWLKIQPAEEMHQWMYSQWEMQFIRVTIKLSAERTGNTDKPQTCSTEQTGQGSHFNALPISM